MWCNMDGISASRRRQKRQAFHSLPLNSRLNYWQMSFCLRNDALARRLYDLMLHRERLQLLHIIHCSVCGWLRQPQIYSGSRSLVTPFRLYNNFLMVFPSWKCCAKFLWAIHSRNLSGWVWVEVSKGEQAGKLKKFLKPPHTPKEEVRSHVWLLVYAGECRKCRFK